MASFLPSPALDVRPASAANNIPDCLSGYTVVSSNHAHEFVLSSVALTDSQNVGFSQLGLRVLLAFGHAFRMSAATVPVPTWDKFGIAHGPVIAAVLHSLLTCSVFHVVVLRAKEQMSRIHAKRVVPARQL